MINRNRFLTMLALAASAGAAAAAINEAIKLSAVSKNLLYEQHPLSYKWRLGNIYYTKSGSGKPLLLVHDLDSASCGYEWNLLINSLKEHYTVYTIDLLGCGRSEKPNFTYTNYLYVQLICDFIKSEIGKKTNVIVSGESVSFVTMACSSSPDLFDKLMFISPKSLTDFCRVPGKHGKMYKFILDLPLVGTMLYNIASSKMSLRQMFCTKYFYNPHRVRSVYINKFYEAAHLGECPKAVFSSLKCNYTKCNIVNALKNINNSIYIVAGSGQDDVPALIEEYRAYNPAIEYSVIANTRQLPHMENPAKVLEYIYIFM